MHSIHLVIGMIIENGLSGNEKRGAIALMKDFDEIWQKLNKAPAGMAGDRVAD